MQGKAAGVSWMGVCDVEVPFHHWKLEPLCSLPSLLAGRMSLCSSESVSSPPAITAT